MRYGLLCLVLATGIAPAQAQDSGVSPKQKPPTAAAAKATPAKPAGHDKASAKSAAAAPAKPLAATPAKAAPKIETTAALGRNGASDLSLRERSAVQAALAWSGDYTGDAVNGEDALTTAIKAYQKRTKTKVTGELTPQERALLVTAASRHEEEFGWRVIDDAATGARIGVPTKMLPLVTEQRNGTRWASKHGDMLVESFRVKDPDVTLASLFERNKKEPATRQIEYSVLRADSFYISGMQGLKKFAVRAFVKDGELRGFVVLFDQAIEGIVAPVTTAMASTYSAFPPANATLAGAAPKRVEYTSGVIASAEGYVLAGRRATDGCNVIVAASLGPAERVAEDRNADLALLRVYGARKLPALPLAGASTQGGDVAIIGVPDPQGGGGSPVTVNARLGFTGAATTLQPAPPPALNGAAVLDRDGSFVGLVQTQNAVVASTAPAAPQPTVISAETIRAFLAGNDIVAAAGRTDIEAAKASAVRIICVRK